MSSSLEPSEVRLSYRDPLIEEFRRTGEIQVGRMRLFMPASFGFCWGVDRALAIVHEARAEHPDRPMWLLSSLIHNPGVNEDLQRLGIGFLKGDAADAEVLENLGPDDVVIVPAFSAPVEDILMLRERGVTLVDTTCPWVVKPHKRVQKYVSQGFTTVIHGTVGHEETASTCSLISHEGGHWIVVHDLEEAQVLVDFLQGKTDWPQLQESLRPGSFSIDLDPQVHCQKLGLVNQTTMLASESRAIGDLLLDAVRQRGGDADLDENFRDFDTICRATQDNQDAASALMAHKPDVFLVVGGWESSNTKNLARVGDNASIPAYHVESADCLTADSIRHRQRGTGKIIDSANWFPTTDAPRVAFAAGASTPDTTLAKVVTRVLEIAGEELP